MFKQEFKIYRPPKPSNRLDQEYHTNEKVWRPSVHYQYTLKDIQQQMTPAEYYRHQLVTSGKEIRTLQRLEWRWLKEYDAFVKAATTVEAGWRGMKGRQEYAHIYGKLVLQRQQREARILANGYFLNDELQMALQVISGLPEPSIALHVMQCKIYYRLQQYEECETIARSIIVLDNQQDEAHFMLGASLAARLNYEAAYHELKNCMTNMNDPREEVFRLNGFVCTKLRPPKYVEAVENFDYLVLNYPEDMNALLQRACCLSALQDWQRAIADLTLILHYQPSLPHVLCIRARCYCCMRQWDKAERDYQAVQARDSTDAMSWYGLQDMQQPYDELPMVDESLVNDASS